MRRLPRSTVLRSLLLVAVCAVVLLLISEGVSDYRNSQLATGAYYFAVLAGNNNISLINSI
jgi:ABC-type transport system involved in cytochrome c biogenesis permease subunit